MLTIKQSIELFILTFLLILIGVFANEQFLFYLAGIPLIAGIIAMVFED